MKENLLFIRHASSAGRTLAVFSDLQGGSDVVLSHEECQRRLDNLKDRDLPFEETEKALINWP